MENYLLPYREPWQSIARGANALPSRLMLDSHFLEVPASTAQNGQRMLRVVDDNTCITLEWNAQQTLS